MKRFIKRLGMLTLLTLSFGSMVSAMSEVEPTAKEIASGINKLAFALYPELAARENSLTFSPLSISTGFSMLYVGSRAETEKAMQSSLFYGANTEAFHRAAGSFTDMLTKTNRTDSGTIMNISNSLWLQKGFKVLPTFSSMLQQSYGAKVKKADFDKNPGLATDAINRTVAEATNNEIPMLFKDPLKSETRFVLTNALYFNAKWASQFEEWRTMDGNFTMLDGNTMTANFMAQDKHFSYGEDDNKQYMLMPYADGEFATLFVLPREGKMDAVKAEMNEEVFNTMMNSMEFKRVSVLMPKFTRRTSPNLKEVLAMTGLGLLFNYRAVDLSGINGVTSGNEKLFVSDVVHEAVVKMFEGGTIAAAATGIGGAVATSMPIFEPNIDFHMVRPFYYFIIHQESGAIMFMGQESEPRV